MQNIAFAYSVLAPVRQGRAQPHLPRCSRRRHLLAARPCACEAPPSVEATPMPEETAQPMPSIPPAAAAGAQALLDDLAARPQYYINVSGVLLGLALSVLVLSATMVALDELPLVPDALRIVGLAYLFWFLSKFLLSGSERRRLQDEIGEFVSVVRGEVADSPGVLEVGEMGQVKQVEGAAEKAEADLVV